MTLIAGLTVTHLHFSCTILSFYDVNHRFYCHKFYLLVLFVLHFTSRFCSNWRWDEATFSYYRYRGVVMGKKQQRSTRTWWHDWQVQWYVPNHVKLMDRPPSFVRPALLVHLTVRPSSVETTLRCSKPRDFNIFQV